MAQVKDRWIEKILSLPLFDEAFKNAIASTPLASMSFIAAVDVESGTEFVQRVFAWSESWVPEVSSVLGDRPLMLEQLWPICKATESSFFESVSFQLGFGLCELGSDYVSKGPSTARAKAFAALVSSKIKAPKRSSSGSQKVETSTPLLDKENGEKLKWAARLEAIGKRAGEHAKLFTEQDQSESLTPAEMGKLRQIVLISGAHRTMAVHVTAFERFEKWAASGKIRLYPLTVDVALKYAMSLDHGGCGPSVVPAFKTAVKWVRSRLSIDLPDLDDHRLVALQAKVTSERATTLKEAIPIPIGVVGAMEVLVISDCLPREARLFVWWLLCAVFASLRFDDAIHVRPDELEMMEEGLFGIAWQTKVERKRAGTRFMVPKVGFSQATWLEVGWELFQQDAPFDRDYWVPELNTTEDFKSEAPTYQRTVQWLRYFARNASDRREQISLEERHRDAVLINQLTAHSCRVTLLDAAVHAGRSTEEIGLQANWKNPGPLVLKYTRNRSQVPAIMIKQLVLDLVEKQHPVQEEQGVELVDACSNDLVNTEFFVKAVASARSHEYKYHAGSLNDSSVLACAKFAVSECISVGSDLPDLKVFCKACAKARPDLVAAYEK